MMDGTANRICGAARAAREIGEESVRIVVEGIPVTVHATPPVRPESEITHRQFRLLDAAITQHPHSRN